MNDPEGFRLMGIVNVTPDSFSDGGRFLQAQEAVAHGVRLIGEGAEIVDVGGESTRPGAEPVSATEELGRVEPVLAGLAAAATAAQISIDTTKASVAEAALAAGARLVNDVSALRADPRMVGLLASSGADCCLMHTLGERRTARPQPRYDDVVDDVKAFLLERLEFAVREGIDEQRVLLDPGIGFGKGVAENLELLRRLDELVALGRPIVIGTSRKSFLGRIAARAGVGEAQERPDVDHGPAAHGARDGAREPPRRLAATLASNVLAFERGASVFRVHEVAPVREALAVAAATLGGRWTESGPGTTRMT